MAPVSCSENVLESGILAAFITLQLLCGRPATLPEFNIDRALLEQRRAQFICGISLIGLPHIVESYPDITRSFLFCQPTPDSTSATPIQPRIPSALGPVAPPKPQPPPWLSDMKNLVQGGLLPEDDPFEQPGQELVYEGTRLAASSTYLGLEVGSWKMMEYESRYFPAKVTSFDDQLDVFHFEWSPYIYREGGDLVPAPQPFTKLRVDCLKRASSTLALNPDQVICLPYIIALMLMRN